jgi:hypothetical protein
VGRCNFLFRLVLLCLLVVRLWSKFLVTSRLRFLLRRIVPLPSTFLTGAIVRCLHCKWFWYSSGCVWFLGGSYLPSLTKQVLSSFTVTMYVPSRAPNRLFLSSAYLLRVDFVLLCIVHCVLPDRTSSHTRNCRACQADRAHHHFVYLLNYIVHIGILLGRAFHSDCNEYCSCYVTGVFARYSYIC